MKKILAVVFAVLFSGEARFASGRVFLETRLLNFDEDARSCPDPGGLCFRWRHMAVLPVGPPLNTFDDLISFLSPNVYEDKGIRKEVFDKKWQMVAAREWGVTPEEFVDMVFNAKQGENVNFVRKSIPACTYIRGDMMYDGADGTEMPKVLRRPLLTEWEDGPKDAWVWQSHVRKWYFFVGCSNPVYEDLIATPKTTPAGGLLTKAPAPPPAPPPPSQSPPQLCPTCPPPSVVSEEVCKDLPQIEFDFHASWYSRSPLPLLFPRNVQELKSALAFWGSAGVGAAGSYGSSQKPYRKTGLWQGAAASAGANMIANFVNPNEDIARVTSGNFIGKVKRGGDPITLPQNKGRVTFDDAWVRVFMKNHSGGDVLCAAAKVGQKINFTPVFIPYRVKTITASPPPTPCFITVNGQLKPCGSPGPRPE